MTHTDPTAEIIALERAALDQWGKGDPSVYLGLFEPDITYFDPLQDRRVQHGGDLAVLTFNLVSYRTADGVERVISKWNATEVYRRTGAGWRMAHSHWSYIRPVTDSVSNPESVTG